MKNASVLAYILGSNNPLLVPNKLPLYLSDEYAEMIVRRLVLELDFVFHTNSGKVIRVNSDPGSIVETGMIVEFSLRPFKLKIGEKEIRLVRELHIDADVEETRLRFTALNLDLRVYHPFSEEARIHGKIEELINSGDDDWLARAVETLNETPDTTLDELMRDEE